MALGAAGATLAPLCPCSRLLQGWREEEAVCMGREPAPARVHAWERAAWGRARECERARARAREGDGARAMSRLRSRASPALQTCRPVPRRRASCVREARGVRVARDATHEWLAAVAGTGERAACVRMVAALSARMRDDENTRYGGLGALRYLRCVPYQRHRKLSRPRPCS